MSVEQYVSSSSITNAFSDVFVVYIRLLFSISGLHQSLASFIGDETPCAEQSHKDFSNGDLVCDQSGARALLHSFWCAGRRAIVSRTNERVTSVSSKQVSIAASVHQSCRQLPLSIFRTLLQHKKKSMQRLHGLSKSMTSFTETFSRSLSYIGHWMRVIKAAPRDPLEIRHQRTALS